MKKLLVVALLFSLSLSTIAATSNAKENPITEKKPKPTTYKILIGGVINYHLANLDLSDNRSFRGLDLSTSNQLGAGVTLNFQSSKKLFFQTGLFYEKRYAEDPKFVSLSANPHAAFFTVDLSYLTVPLVGGYFFSNGDTRPYVAGGVHIGKGLKQEITNEFAPDAPSFVENTKPNIQFEEGVEYGIILETGIQKKLRNNNFVNINIRYTGTERTLSVNKTLAGGGGVNLGTRQFSLSVAYLVSL